MDKKLDIKGRWWLPKNPEHKVYGTLEYSRGNIGKLELFGGLELDTQSTLIIGESSTGDKYTLNDCYVNSFRSGSHGFRTMIYNVYEIFENVHFETKNDIKFEGISVQFSNTLQWSRLSALEIDQELFEGTFSLDFNLPKPKCVEFENKNELCLELYSRYPQFLREVSSKIEIEQFSIFTFRFDKAKKFEEISHDYVRHLQNLLTLAITHPVSIEFLCGHINHPGYESAEEIRGKPVNIYLHWKDNFNSDRDIIYQNMLFTFPDVEEKWESLIANWFQKREQLEPVITLYFSTLYNSYLYVENNFLSLVNALESYHRRTFDTQEFEEEKKNELIKQVQDAVDEKYHQVISRKLNYMNEPSLRSRLKEVYDSNRKVLDKYIRRKQFCDKTYVTRNYYTHYDENLKSRINKIDPVDLIKKLEIVIEVCLLKELGFELSEIENCLENRGDHKIRISRREKT